MSTIQLRYFNEDITIEELYNYLDNRTVSERKEETVFISGHLVDDKNLLDVPSNSSHVGFETLLCTANISSTLSDVKNAISLEVTRKRAKLAVTKNRTNSEITLNDISSKTNYKINKKKMIAKVTCNKKNVKRTSRRETNTKVMTQSKSNIESIRLTRSEENVKKNTCRLLNVKPSKSLNFIEYRCFLCDLPHLTFPAFSNLLVHVTASHVVSEEIICPFCVDDTVARRIVAPITHSKLADILQHLVWDHNMAIPEYILPYKCTQEGCSYFAVCKSYLDLHTFKHKDERVDCEDCGKPMKTRSMNLHREVCDAKLCHQHHHNCPIENCGKKFLSQQGLKSHFHKNRPYRKNFVCSVCQCLFYDRSPLEVHMFDHHKINITDNNVLNCSVCHYTAVHKHVLMSHVKNSHPKLFLSLSNENKNHERLLTVSKTSSCQSQISTVSDKSCQSQVSDISDCQSQDHRLTANKESSVNDLEQPECATKIEAFDARPKPTQLVQIDNNIYNDDDTVDISTTNCDDDNVTCDGLSDFFSSEAGNQFCLESQTTDLESNERVEVDRNFPDVNGCFIGEAETDNQMQHRQRPQRNDVNTSLVSHLSSFKCFVCRHSVDVFPCYKQLKHHITQTHTSTDRHHLKCSYCSDFRVKFEKGINQKSLGRVLGHMISSHNHEVPDFLMPYHCKHGDCTFTSLVFYDIKDHNNRHRMLTQRQTVACDKCGKLMLPVSMKLHRRACVMDDTTKAECFPCSYCEKELRTEMGLSRHIMVHHNNRKDYLCTHCPRRFASRSELEDHTFCRHGENLFNKTVFKCSKCLFQTIKEFQLKRHVNQAHSNTKTFECTVCQKCFKTKSKNYVFLLD